MFKSTNKELAKTSIYRTKLHQRPTAKCDKCNEDIILC